MTWPEGGPDYPERVILHEAGNPVELRGLVPDDAADYFALVDSSRVHLSQHGEDTASKYPSVDAVLESIVNPKDPAKYRFGMWVGGKMVGSSNILPGIDGMSEVGSWVAKEYTGHGYAAHSRALLIDFAFNRLNMQTVLSQVNVNNVPSRRSVERSGFTLRSIEGDACMYRLDRPDTI